jgi:hypothetical protein
MKRILLGALLGACLSTGAYAQTPVTNEAFNITAQLPESWTQLDGADRAVFNFKHDESHSQIEIIGTQLLTPDVASVFFDTFHSTLTSSEFVQSGREQKTYGDYTGTETIYAFTHSGVTLKVAVFEFVRETTAWLVVGYIQEDRFDQYAPTYQTVIQGLSFQG